MKITNEHFSVKFGDNHPLDHLKFVFSQADKRLDDSHKTFDATTSKSVTIITLSVALLSTLCGYFFVNNDISGELNAKLITVLLLAVYVFYITIYLLRNILPYDYQPSGSLPSQLLTKSPFTEKTVEHDELHLKDIYYSELVNYDFRIQHNFAINSTRLSRIKQGIILLISTPVVGLLCYAITAFLLA